MTQVALSQLRPVTTAVAILATFESLWAFERVALGARARRSVPPKCVYLVYMKRIWSSALAAALPAASLRPSGPPRDHPLIEAARMSLGAN